MSDLLVNYLGIALVLVLTGMGLPVPEEVPIIAAGVASSHGLLNPWGAFFACLVGALIGDCMLYSIGKHFGRNLVQRQPRLAQWLHADYEAGIERMLRRHGLKVFFVARFMVGVRAPVYLTAGILRMDFRRFLLVDAICATTVVGVFFGLSYYYGEHISNLYNLVRRSELALTCVIVVGIGCVLFYFWRKSRHAARLTAPCDEDHDHGPPQDDPKVRTKTLA